MVSKEALHYESTNILDCFPFFHWNQVMEELHRHKNSPIRVMLALENLFRVVDAQDNSVASDIASVKKLLPNICDAEVREAFRTVGHLPNRKAFIVRLLLTKQNARKRVFHDDVFGHVQPKMPCTVTTKNGRCTGSLFSSVLKGPQQNLQNVCQNIQGVPKNLREMDQNLRNKSCVPQNLQGQPNTHTVIKQDDGYILNKYMQDVNRPSTSRDALIAEADTTISDRLKWLHRVETKNGYDSDVPDLSDSSESSDSSDTEDEKQIKDTPKEETPTVVHDNTNKSLEPNELIVIDESQEVEQNRQDEARAMPIAVDVDKKLYYAVLEMFPETCPKYIRGLCADKKYSHVTLDHIINTILTDENHPKREREPSPELEVDPEEQLEMVKQILPDADPSYLQINVERLLNNSNQLKEFIANALETKDYPTMKEYLRKQQLSAQMRQYTSDFSVKKFLEVIPHPEQFFTNKDRKSMPESREPLAYHYALIFLKNYFDRVPVSTVAHCFKNGVTITEVFKKLDRFTRRGDGVMKTRRKPRPLPENVQNIPLLQEIAFLEHREEIAAYIKEEETRHKAQKEKAKQLNLLRTCSCCYEDEVMPDDCFRCEKDCEFCKDCIRKSVEIAFGEGKLNFGCLGDCDASFDLYTLQSVLDPKLFSKLALKKQVEEIKSAGIENLETCPFCDFATIPNPEDKLFRCMNEDCMKESCRLCKEPSHIPLRCEEVEKDEDVKKRVYIENKMTEALLRKCYKCGLKFIKADGCNKMTCSCGAMMCYVCGKPVENYKHFNGQGGDQYHLCPLYSDTNQLHQEQVLKSAAEAKKEIGVTDKKDLKHDPTADVVDHYKEMAKKMPPVPNANMFPPNGHHHAQLGRPPGPFLQEFEHLNGQLNELMDHARRIAQRMPNIQDPGMPRAPHRRHHYHHHNHN